MWRRSEPIHACMFAYLRAWCRSCLFVCAIVLCVRVCVCVCAVSCGTCMDACVNVYKRCRVLCVRVSVVWYVAMCMYASNILMHVFIYACTYVCIFCGCNVCMHLRMSVTVLCAPRVGEFMYACVFACVCVCLFVPLSDACMYM